MQSANFYIKKNTFLTIATWCDWMADWLNLMDEWSRIVRVLLGMKEKKLKQFLKNTKQIHSWIKEYNKHETELKFIDFYMFFSILHLMQLHCKKNMNQDSGNVKYRYICAKEKILILL